MSAIPQQVLAGQKASLDNLLAIQGSFFGGFEKLVDLNLKVIKATLDEVAQKSQQAIEVKDAQEALAFTSGLVQPNAEKALAYSKHVRSEEHTSELQSLMRISYAVFCLKKNTTINTSNTHTLN